MRGQLSTVNLIIPSRDLWTKVCTRDVYTGFAHGAHNPREVAGARKGSPCSLRPASCVLHESVPPHAGSWQLALWSQGTEVKNVPAGESLRLCMWEVKTQPSGFLSSRTFTALMFHSSQCSLHWKWDRFFSSEDFNLWMLEIKKEQESLHLLDVILCQRPTDGGGKVRHTGSQPSTSTTGTKTPGAGMPKKPVTSLWLQIPKWEYRQETTENKGGQRQSWLYGHQRDV